MSESNDRQSVGERQTPQARSRRRFLAGALTGVLLGSMLAGGVSLYAHAQPGPGWWFGAGRGPGGYFRHAAYDPEMVRTRIEFATDWILSRIEASDAQHQQVKAIVQATVQDLAQMREQHHQNRQTLLGVTGSGKTFTAANVIAQLGKPRYSRQNSAPGCWSSLAAGITERLSKKR